MKKILFILLFIFLFEILFVISCAKTEQQTYPKNVPIISSEDVSKLTPEQVVKLYFQSWNGKKYDVMYSAISDGFKQIEPTAKKFEDFKAYMNKFYESSSGINIVEVKETYKNEKEAGINYKIEITEKDDAKKEFSSTYTLKKRANGWKLIHPYGNNIDKS